MFLTLCASRYVQPEHTRCAAQPATSLQPPAGLDCPVACCSRSLLHCEAAFPLSSLSLYIRHVCLGAHVAAGGPIVPVLLLRLRLGRRCLLVLVALLVDLVGRSRRGHERVQAVRRLEALHGVLDVLRVEVGEVVVPTEEKLNTKRNRKDKSIVSTRFSQPSQLPPVRARARSCGGREHACKAVPWRWQRAP